ncbi:hypothetical protein HU200_011073 [Digitaria exilis]|uniref:Uncharacterized protein n=1 Tax=Digitaria exilis TaxID=1010633 RepID=A0A835FGX1_9POAL|nr:hypothetical protein HU200_064417 [Digitaria exilis]KAF8756345.1 hypothetical protein HU200_011073 [Digitaria exilis]
MSRVPAGEKDAEKKAPPMPPPENNGLPRVSSQPPSDAVSAAPARTMSHN